MTSSSAKPSAPGSGKKAKLADAPPRDLPAPLPLLPELPAEARGPAVYAWQLLRCLASELTIDEGQPFRPPTLEQLSTMLLRGSPAVDGPTAAVAMAEADATFICGGRLGEVHRALLRACLQDEHGSVHSELYAIDNEQLLLPPLEGDTADGDTDEVESDESQPTAAAAQVGGQGGGQGGGGHASRSAEARFEAQYATRAPVSAAMVLRLRDAAKLVDELS